MLLLIDKVVLHGLAWAGGVLTSERVERGEGEEVVVGSVLYCVVHLSLRSESLHVELRSACEPLWRGSVDANGTKRWTKCEERSQPGSSLSSREKATSRFATRTLYNVVLAT